MIFSLSPIIYLDFVRFILHKIQQLLLENVKFGDLLDKAKQGSNLMI